MNTKLLRTVGLLVLAGGMLSATGCWLRGVKGSGVKATDARTVSAFTEVLVKCSADVNITIGTPQSVVVETDDNLIPLITTTVKGATLEVDASGNYSTKLGVKIEITVASIEAVKISGSGDVTVKGIAGTSFEAGINGSGDIEAEGLVTKVKATISGSGDIDLAKLACVSAEAKVSGSGDIVVNVAKDLDAKVSGSGDIRYLGKPTVTQKISGSGDVRAK